MMGRKTVIIAVATCYSLFGSTPMLGFVRPNACRGRRRPRRRCLCQLSTTNYHEDDAYSLLSDTLTRRIFMAEDPEVTRLEILNQRIVDDLDLKISKTTVQPSPIAGRGLFATVDCQPGDILTCYPGDGVIQTLDPEDEESWSIVWGNHITAPEDRSRTTMKDLSETIRGYILYMDQEHSIVGLPHYDTNPSYLGHFSNDGATCPPTCPAEVEAYVQESNAACNARHEGVSGDCHMVTVATRTISAGDEIFVTYGAEYWMQQASYNA
eukprot:scaffold2033_cov164-Amphora_coffeaeformis.AAC.28